jgi:hypothetical protein
MIQMQNVVLYEKFLEKQMMIVDEIHHHNLNQHKMRYVQISETSEISFFGNLNSAASNALKADDIADRIEWLSSAINTSFEQERPQLSIFLIIMCNFISRVECLSGIVE